MLLDEVYRYCDENWSNITKYFHFGSNTYQYWRKIGYIPYKSQKIIERKSSGALTADINHDETLKDI